MNPIEKDQDGTLMKISIDIKDDCIIKDVKHFIDRIQRQYSVLVGFRINDILTFKLKFRMRVGSLSCEKRCEELKDLFSKYDDIIDDYEIKVIE